MFQRQWFDRASQIGLMADWLVFEERLRDKRFNECLSFLSLKEKKASISLEKAYNRRQILRIKHILRRQSSNSVSVYFHSFWPSFKYDTSIFPCLFRDSLKILSMEHVQIQIVDTPFDCDIAIGSCFQNHHEVQKGYASHATSILYLGENVRPCYTNYDHSFSCDKDFYAGRNSYLPVILASLYEDKVVNFETYPRLKDLLHSFSSEYAYYHLCWAKREDKVLFVGNNYEPKRAALLGQLQSMGISCIEYGSHSNPVRNKAALYGKYRYILCPENSYYPGYMTEKLLHGICSDARILHWGYVPDQINVTLGDRLIEITDSNITSIFLEIKNSRQPTSSLPSVLEETYKILSGAYNRCIRSLAKLIALYV